MTVKNEEELRGLLEIGRICGLTLQHMAACLQPGMTTAELDAIGAEFLAAHGARSAPILAYQFPGHTCISVNEEAAHGIPGARVIGAGDMVNIDVSAEKDGFWADTGASYCVPPVGSKQQRLLDATREALEMCIQTARAGVPINAIGHEIEKFARKHGFQVIEELGGHGVGRGIHEDPSVPNVYRRGASGLFTEGMVVTLEPFLTLNTRHVVKLNDGWTLKTRNGGLVAQFEHTVVITKGQPILVTAV